MRLGSARMRDRTSPAARAALVGAAVLCLLAVVGLAARGGLGRAGGGSGPSQGILDWSFSVFFVLYVAAIPFAVWAYWQQARNERERRGPARRGGRFVQNAFVFLMFLAIAVGLTRLRQSHLHSVKLHGLPSATAHGRKKAGGKPLATEPRFRWPVLVVAGVAAAGGGAAYLVLRRRKGPLRERGGAAEALGLALDDAIDDVRAETDPRRAVIKAYARMEAVLAAHGLPREPAEAPYEYLARALDAVDASAPSVGRLTDLFERAKFSLHEIDGGMREEAIEALTAVRDELRGGLEAAA